MTMMTYYDPWPLESGRKFESEHFTEEELWAKCQENGWLKTGGEMFEDNPWAEEDYTFSAYECQSLMELRNAFLYGNWSIRQCFVYKDLAFINQINAGDEWLALKKQADGKLQEFDSITMVAVINNTKEQFIKRIDGDFPYRTQAKDEAERLTKILQETFGEKAGRFYVPYNKDHWRYDLYFEYIDHDYFRNYINEMVEATVLRWYGYREIDGVRQE